MAATVATPSAEVAEMQPDWELVEALMGGTREMREHGVRYLPRWPNEQDEAYKTRLATAVLFPAYSRTITTLAGKPFAQPITIGDDVPEPIRLWAEDIDLQGRNLHAFCAEAFRAALGYGLSGILVDYPRMDGLQTLADERAAGARPYFVLVKCDDILGWRATRRAGKWVIDQLRIKECAEEPDGEFGVKGIDQVRVLTPGAWAVYREDKTVAGQASEWRIHEQGLTSLPYVPFVPVYGEREGFMEGRPPLIEMAHLNVAHWQSASDQQTILHIARVPILTTIGAEDGAAVTVGAASAVNLPRGADMKFVEHSGAAIAAGKEDLADLEERMRQAGAELLSLQPGKITATQVRTENSVGMSALQSMAQSFEDAIDAALQIMADWTGLPTGGHVTLCDDYGQQEPPQASGDLLLKANQAGKISDATLIGGFKRLGILDGDVDAQTEAEAVAAQGPALGMIADTPQTTGADPVVPQPPAAPATAPAAPAPDFGAFASAIADALRQVVINAPAVTIEAQPVAPAAPIAMPAITVESPTITVNVPEQPASVVNVAQPAITVAAPNVTVNNEAQPAPVVNVAPAAVTVNTPVQPAPQVSVTTPPVNVRVDRAGKVTFTEDAAGNITGASLE